MFLETHIFPGSILLGQIETGVSWGNAHTQRVQSRTSELASLHGMDGRREIWSSRPHIFSTIHTSEHRIDSRFLTLKFGLGLLDAIFSEAGFFLDVLARQCRKDQLQKLFLKAGCSVTIANFRPLQESLNIADGMSCHLQLLHETTDDVLFESS